ncbi:MAG: CDP-alcohol phosphatidyltransferase family protein [Nitrosomonas sp.]|nr:MAG: CDP-alcohol phosphatidyltransferase family protein [Nitrosomonas sp.]
MSHKQKAGINLPNLISMLRVLMAPMLFYFAMTGEVTWFFCTLGVAVFTDVLDGFSARMLNQMTVLGSHLDSWGDFIIYTTLAICAWILWPEIVRREQHYFIIILLCFTVPVIVGLIKLRTVTGYHTWSVKLAVAVTLLGYVLLFSGISEWIFRIAAVFCLYAALEEIAITLLIHREHTDIRTVWQAYQLRRKGL